MSTPPDDRDLQEAFARARRIEGAHAPDFHGLLRSSARRRRSWHVPAALAAAAAVVAVTLLPVQTVHRDQHVGMLVPLAEPTAFLLRTPGIDLLSSTPSLGSPAAGLDASQPTQ
jgi:hypothetical protein